MKKVTIDLIRLIVLLAMLLAGCGLLLAQENDRNATYNAAKKLARENYYLHSALTEAGWTDEQIDSWLVGKLAN